MTRKPPTRRRTLTAARDCPVCAEPVHWTRYWLKSWAWAKWSCPRCRSILGFDKKRRSLMVVPVFLWLMLFSFLQSRYATPVAFLAVCAGMLTMGLLERVVVIDNRNPRYCRSCRYDLSGTQEAGINTCPECGTIARPPG